MRPDIIDAPDELDEIATALRRGDATPRAQMVAANAVNMLATRLRMDERDRRERSKRCAPSE